MAVSFFVLFGGAAGTLCDAVWQLLREVNNALITEKMHDICVSGGFAHCFRHVQASTSFNSATSKYCHLMNRLVDLISSPTQRANLFFTLSVRKRTGFAQRCTPDFNGYDSCRQAAYDMK